MAFAVLMEEVPEYMRRVGADGDWPSEREMNLALDKLGQTALQSVGTFGRGGDRQG